MRDFDGRVVLVRDGAMGIGGGLMAPGSWARGAGSPS